MTKIGFILHTGNRCCTIKGPRAVNSRLGRETFQPAVKDFSATQLLLALSRIRQVLWMEHLAALKTLPARLRELDLVQLLHQQHCWSTVIIIERGDFPPILTSRLLASNLPSRPLSHFFPPSLSHSLLLSRSSMHSMIVPTVRQLRTYKKAAQVPAWPLISSKGRSVQTTPHRDEMIRELRRSILHAKFLTDSDLEISYLRNA